MTGERPIEENASVKPGQGALAIRDLLKRARAGGTIIAIELADGRTSVARIPNKSIADEVEAEQSEG